MLKSLSARLALVVSTAAVGLLFSSVSGVQSADAGGPNLVCCENDNGTIHPVSENGRAADHCVETWDIPAGENPAAYCDDPQEEACEDIAIELTCDQRTDCNWGGFPPACATL